MRAWFEDAVSWCLITALGIGTVTFFVGLFLGATYAAHLIVQRVVYGG